MVLVSNNWNVRDVVKEGSGPAERPSHYDEIMKVKELQLQRPDVRIRQRTKTCTASFYAKSVLDGIGLSAPWPGDDTIGQYRISHSCTLIQRIDRVGQTNGFGLILNSSVDQKNEMERSDYVCRAIVRHKLLVDVFVLGGARIGLAPGQGRLGEA